MIKQFIYIISIVITFSLLTSCNEDSLGIEENVNHISDDAAVIKPLKVGNSWDYDIILYDENGNEFSRGEQSNSIESESLISSETWFVEKQITNTTELFLSLANRDDGLWSGGPGGRRIVEYPVKVGDEFLVSSYSKGQDDFEIWRTVKAVRKIVEVPAGTFICIEYSDRRIKNGNLDLDPIFLIYYSPNYGHIKTLRFTKLESGRQIMYEEQVLRETAILSE